MKVIKFLCNVAYIATYICSVTGALILAIYSSYHCSSLITTIQFLLSIIAIVMTLTYDEGYMRMNMILDGNIDHVYHRESKIWRVNLFVLIFFGLFMCNVNNIFTDHTTKTREEVTAERNVERLKAYRGYYKATETILDSLGIDCDSWIIETDAGVDYLNNKAYVDSID